MSDKDETQPVRPISGSPEREPSGEKKDIEIHEVIEHEPSSEAGVSQHVKPRAETVDVPKEAKEVGVISSGTPSFTTTKPVSLPISDDKVLWGLHAPITSSLRWLAQFCLYLLKSAHMTLKEVHGHAKRIVSK